MEATQTNPRSININVQCTKHNVQVPKLNVSHKCDDPRMHYRGFINQIKLLFDYNPNVILMIFVQLVS